ncbi:MAG: hypothetical protein Q9221_007244 [Calogaya cf. arnoldii]
MEKSNTTAQSALYGRPPNTDNDYWIVKALLFEQGIADADPAKGLPFEHFPLLSDENRSGSIIAAVTISIFLIVAITATRLVARKTIRTSSLGWDDALISVAALMGVVFFSIIGAMVTYGAAGHHLYSITYIQYYWLLRPYATVGNYIAAGKAVPNLKCNSNNPGIGLALQILHALLDWVLLAVPVIILIRLKMTWQRKIQYYFASQLPWTIVDIVCAICVTSLPAINNLLIHHLPRHLSQYWSGGDPGSGSSPITLYPSHGPASRDLNNGRIVNGVGGIFDETKQIMVQRDVDLESMRTEIEENPDAGYLELGELNRSRRRGNSTKYTPVARDKKQD